MRAPAFGAPTTELYNAATEMCAWAETRGAIMVVLSEHHGADDNHLPVPLVLAAAIAARTQQIPILLAAVVLPLYEPVRLAEEMNVLDILSGGRVSYVFGIGHRSDEYEQFGIDMRRRAALADQNLTLVRALLGGAPVLHQGRTIHVTPPPATPGGPRVMIGGGSIAAAERAGRHGLALVAQANPPGMKEAYEAACRAHGHEPQPGIYPEPGRPTAVFVADDVDRAWDELGPHLLHDAMTAASYRHGPRRCGKHLAGSERGRAPRRGPVSDLHRQRRHRDHSRRQLPPVGTPVRRHTGHGGVAVSRASCSGGRAVRDGERGRRPTTTMIPTSRAAERMVETKHSVQTCP